MDSERHRHGSVERYFTDWNGHQLGPSGMHDEQLLESRWDKAVMHARFIDIRREPPSYAARDEDHRTGFGRGFRVVPDANSQAPDTTYAISSSRSSRRRGRPPPRW